MCSSYRDLSAQLGGFAGLVLLLSKCLVAGIPRLIGSSRGEGISFVDRESLSWAKLGHPCRVLSFESRARGYEADGNLLMSGCRKPEVDLNYNTSTARVTVMVSSRRGPGSEHGVGVMFDVGRFRITSSFTTV